MCSNISLPASSLFLNHTLNTALRKDMLPFLMSAPCCGKVTNWQLQGKEFSIQRLGTRLMVTGINPSITPPPAHLSQDHKELAASDACSGFMLCDLFGFCLSAETTSRGANYCQSRPPFPQGYLSGENFLYNNSLSCCEQSLPSKGFVPSNNLVGLGFRPRKERS